MNIALTEKRRWFLERMTQDSEHAQWGFELLLKREDFAEFFDHLKAHGLFEPSNNPAPIPVDDGKYIQVPYWPALGYLEACAKLAGENNDFALATKILAVVRDVTIARKNNNGVPDNRHTSVCFAEILGFIPTSIISQDDIDLIPTLLDSRFDHGTVGHALDKGLMRHLLESENREDWRKACKLLWHSTAIKWVEGEGLEKTRKNPVTIVDDYWLHELIKNHASVLGSKARVDAANVFLERLRDVYKDVTRANASWLFRPAVEDHKQNHEWGGADNRFVEGLRDVLLTWLDVDPVGAAPYVESLLAHDAEIVRRVALHVVSQRWNIFHNSFSKFIRPELFARGHLHELYCLLRDHFSSFTPQEMTLTVNSIRQIPISDKWTEPEISLKRIQRDWLSAINGQGSTDADTWFATLNAEESLGRLIEHPDFHSYMESWSGSGPTPFRAEQLIEFARAGSLIQQMNAFEPINSWHGPSRRSLVDALEEAVTIAPEMFLTVMPEFGDAQRAYQYGVISGFKRLWETPKEKAPDINWDKVWSVLMKFFEQLINNDAFWEEHVVDDLDLTPTRDWIPPLISEFLRSGTRNDEKVYGEDLLPRSWQLICILLEKSKAESEIRDDAMTQAINSPKGKAIEALFSHALRICRLGDCTRNKIHTSEWEIIQPIFDIQLNKCLNANFEFSTLAGAYVAQIEYMSRDWLDENIERIFSAEYPGNFFCAIAGLAYAPAMVTIYRLLAGRGILDRSLHLDLRGHNVREQLIERIALAYLWGEEEIASTRFAYFFDNNRAEDLQIVSNFLWRVNNQEINEDQVRLILEFWQKCIEWCKELNVIHPQLLSSLSLLSVYLETLGAKEAVWLEYVAPYISTNHNADRFIEQLLRLAEVNPSAVSATFSKVLETYEPYFDYQDKMKALILQLAKKGLKIEAISFADRLRRLPGMQELYLRLVG